ncbi:MAG: potassium channel protein [Arcobacter sp.]|nr:MAG: potassium channel protein [Arcobacter sp.]
MKELKKHLYTIFEHPTSHSYGIFVHALIFLNIIVSIVIMFLQTEKSLASYYDLFDTINTINVILFTFEYILRLYSINYYHEKGRLKFIFTPFMIIDLIVILPFYLSMFNFDLGFLRALRIIRIFKLFRVVKYAEFDNLLFSILREKKEEFIFIFVGLSVVVLTLTPIVYYFEKDAQPEVFTSMLTTMWWAVITFTTVGYGDMFPVTAVGRILTAIVSFLGIALYAIPGSIFTSALLEKMNDRKKKKREK